MSLTPTKMASCPYYVLGHDISDDEITDSFDVIDSNKDKRISREEFLNAAYDFFFNVDESEVANAFLGGHCV